MSEVEARPSPIHGLGLFALRPFDPGERLATYAGPIVDRHPGPDAQGMTHAMELEPGCWIDGRDADNLARHANHSCDPNAEAIRKGDVVHLIARRRVAAGEEITFDYGYGLPDALDQPCRCGAGGCPGRIIAGPLRASLRRHLRRRQSRD